MAIGDKRRGKPTAPHRRRLRRNRPGDHSCKASDHETQSRPLLSEAEQSRRGNAGSVTHNGQSLKGLPHFVQGGVRRGREQAQVTAHRYEVIPDTDHPKRLPGSGAVDAGCLAQGADGLSNRD